MRTINFTTSYEELISRIPGLFAYIELNEKGISVLHKATDSPMGCYGKIVENIVYGSIPETSINIKNTIKFEDGEVLTPGETYSYKTLIRLYYKYLNSDKKPEKFNEFKNFIEYGIGKVEVSFEGLDRKENDLVPYYVYLSTVRNLYEEMLKLNLKCKFYENHKKNRDKIDNETETELCCKCVLYKRKGGDGMLGFLQGLLNEANVRSEKWFNQVSNNKKLYLNYSINLFTTEKDMGILTPLNNKVIIPETENNTNYKLKSETYDYIVNDNKVTIGGKEYEVKDAKNTKITIDGVKDNKVINSIRCNIAYTTNSKLKSLRRFKTYLNKYDVEERPEPNKDWLFYYRVGQICNLLVLNDDYGNIMTVETSLENIKKDMVVSDLMAFGDVIESIELDVKNRTLKFIYWTDVHLKSKCNGVSYDEDGNKKVTYADFTIDTDYLTKDEDIKNHHGIKYIEIYNFDEDSEINSLFYGTFPYDETSKIIIDDKGKTITIEYPVNDGKITINRKVYTVKDAKITINSIAYDQYITFRSTNYGVKDNKVLIEYPVNDVKITINGIAYDQYIEIDGVNYGVKNEFKDYVNGNYDIKSENLKLFEKYEFSTYNNTKDFEKMIGYNTVNYKSIVSDEVNILVDRKKDSDTVNDIVRLEFYNGISYSPTEDFDIDINRGITSIFDRHIRFSEVKTLQDMEEYMNGSFFKIQ